MSKQDPAFKIVAVVGAISSKSLFKIVGPDGLTWTYEDTQHLAEITTARLERAFDAGCEHEAKKHRPPVPGPQSPPRKIHPTQVG